MPGPRKTSARRSPARFASPPRPAGAPPPGRAGFVPSVKLDPSAVRDLRADTRSERAAVRRAQPAPSKPGTSEKQHRMGRQSMTTKPGRRNPS